jgi:hypothetical protein
MSDLRKQLELAKSEYERVSYPGNLAADVLHPRRSMIFRLIVSAAAVSAVAAAVALWMTIQPLATRSTKPNVATAVHPAPAKAQAVSQPAQDATQFSWAIPVPQFPTEEMHLLPSGASLAMPAMPSMPTFQDIQESEKAESTATTQEAV